MTIEDVTISKCANGWIVAHKLGPTFIFGEFRKVLYHLETYFNYPICDGD